MQRLRRRLDRLEQSTSCPGPVIEIVECYEGEEPPEPQPCPCGREHPDELYQLVLAHDPKERRHDADEE